MKAAIAYGDGKLAVEETPVPQPDEYQALAKIEACSTCNSTDLKIIDGKLPFVREYPAVLGHESVGTVVEVGAKVRNFQVGKRYFRPTAAYPGTKLGKIFSGWGGFAEYGLLTDYHALVEDGADPAKLNPYARLHQEVPEAVSPEDATMMITLKEVLDNIQHFGVRLGKPFAVFGTGAVGCCFLLFAKLLGAYPVVAIARREESLARAKRFGADAAVNTSKGDMRDAVLAATGGGADAVVDCAGSVEFLSKAPALLAPGGRLGVYGVDTSSKVTLDLYSAAGGWSLVLTQQDETRSQDQLAGYVRMGVVRLAEFYSHVMGLEEIGKGVALLRSKEAFKVVVRM
ncbi:MAG: zinc-binding dehydrogenase [Planctomycetota bacterium]